mmetsp:Transcript_16204/g.41292  ORF Transcript_16204/g.41292 Transcript_16204/m.41292 type:complete len:204 (-) Transcript_16204:2843-3454(-)
MRAIPAMECLFSVSIWSCVLKMMLARESRYSASTFSVITAYTFESCAINKLSISTAPMARKVSQSAIITLLSASKTVKSSNSKSPMERRAHMSSDSPKLRKRLGASSSSVGGASCMMTVKAFAQAAITNANTMPKTATSDIIFSTIRTRMPRRGHMVRYLIPRIQTSTAAMAIKRLRICTTSIVTHCSRSASSSWQLEYSLGR